MENLRIVYTNQDGSVSIVVPAPDYAGTMEELAEKVVPQGVTYRIIATSDLPASRNWRNAWTDANPTDTVDIDLEKAKVEHIMLMQRKNAPVAEVDTLRHAVQDVTTLTELYNIWPASIEKRSGTREYIVHLTPANP